MLFRWFVLSSNTGFYSLLCLFCSLLGTLGGCGGGFLRCHYFLWSTFLRDLIAVFLVDFLHLWPYQDGPSK